MFEKKTSAENWSADREKLLQKRLNELGLKLEGTRLEKLVERLYEDPERWSVLNCSIFMSIQTKIMKD
jgi:hypothetical protein